MRSFQFPILYPGAGLFSSFRSFGQFIIAPNNTATALAQKLVGEGVLISNATITNNSIITGFS